MSYVPAHSALGAYHLLDDIVVPDDAATLAAFQNLQRQLNALLNQKGEPLVSVDGRVGSQTFASVLTLISNPGDFPDPQSVADNVAALNIALADMVERLGASYIPDPVTSSPPSVPSGAGVVNPPDDVIRQYDGGMSTTTMALIAAGIGIGVALLIKKKRRKR